MLSSLAAPTLVLTISLPPPSSPPHPCYPVNYRRLVPKTPLLVHLRPVLRSVPTPAPAQPRPVLRSAPTPALAHPRPVLRPVRIPALLPVSAPTQRLVPLQTQWPIQPHRRQRALRRRTRLLPRGSRIQTAMKRPYSPLSLLPASLLPRSLPSQKTLLLQRVKGSASQPSSVFQFPEVWRCSVSLASWHGSSPASGSRTMIWTVSVSICHSDIPPFYSPPTLDCPCRALFCNDGARSAGMMTEAQKCCKRYVAQPQNRVVCSPDSCVDHVRRIHFADLSVQMRP
ncbi:hypothetical protein C8Q74DRAFT_609016 [Fomes fomentarius]|nr:hypothetical protein C8Q74DRAFT_609016 [Fomes fomentarius]